MTFEEFKPLAIRTLKYKENFAADFTHMTLGLGSEINEYFEASYKGDLVNIAEELGDMLWYLAVLSVLLNRQHPSIEINVNFNTRYAKNIDDLEKELIEEISLLQNFSKRAWVYNKELNEEDYELIEQSVFTCLILIDVLFNIHDLNAEVAMEKIINKLKARYPDKYTDGNALNRDLETERKELEND